jgi:hypothetical protein
MDIPHPLAGVDAKLARAETHLSEYLVAEKSYLASPFPERQLIRNYDALRGAAFRAFHADRVVPLELSVIAGEVLYQLRSALDHVVTVFVQRAGGNIRDKQFPIWTHDPAGDRKDRARRNAQTAGIEPGGRVSQIIDAAQPYKRRRPHHDHLAVLKSLNNQDKHTSLVLHIVNTKPMLHLTVRDGAEVEDYMLDSDESLEQIQGIQRINEIDVEVAPVLTTHLAFATVKGRTDERVGDVLGGIAAHVRALVDRFRPEIETGTVGHQ